MPYKYNPVGLKICAGLWETRHVSEPGNSVSSSSFPAVKPRKASQQDQPRQLRVLFSIAMGTDVLLC